jgi:hypothetical protein
MEKDDPGGVKEMPVFQDAVCGLFAQIAIEAVPRKRMP